MMKQLLSHTATSIVLAQCILICGCATAPSPDLNKASSANVRRVAVLIYPKPEDAISAGNIGGVASGFGLIGVLVQTKNNENRSRQLSDAVKKSKTSLSDALQVAVQKSLRENGFDVLVLNDQVPKLSRDRKSYDFSGIHAEADAILSIDVSVGYDSKNFSDYDARALAFVSLIRSETKELIYQRFFSAGLPFEGLKNVTPLPGDPFHHYPSFEDVLAKIDDAVEGMATCEVNIAKAIGEALKESRNH